MSIWNDEKLIDSSHYKNVEQELRSSKKLRSNFKSNAVTDLTPPHLAS